MSSDLSHVPVLVPEGVTDPVEMMPLGVIDAACHHLKCDVVDAARGGVPGKRWAALAEILFQLARMSGVEKPERETYRNYTVAEMNHALGWDREEPAPDPTPTGGSSAGSSESSSLELSGDSRTSSTESL